MDFATIFHSEITQFIGLALHPSPSLLNLTPGTLTAGQKQVSLGQLSSPSQF